MELTSVPSTEERDSIILSGSPALISAEEKDCIRLSAPASLLILE